MVGPWSTFYSVEDLKGSEKVASWVAVKVCLLVLHEDRSCPFSRLTRATLHKVHNWVVERILDVVVQEVLG